MTKKKHKKPSWLKEFWEDGWDLESDTGNMIALIITFIIVGAILYAIVEALLHWAF